MGEGRVCEGRSVGRRGGGKEGERVSSLTMRKTERTYPARKYREEEKAMMPRTWWARVGTGAERGP